MSWLAVGGNAALILWVLYNGIDEGFCGTPPEIASWLGLTALLILNSVLIVSGRKR